MNLQDIYNLALDIGIKNDLRGSSFVKKKLAKLNAKYNTLKGEEKNEFDKEKLINPYSDTRILADNKREVTKAMMGIDITPSELLIAKELGVDTVISHHPLGIGLADLGDVMHLQSDVLAQYGVPINIAEALTKERISEVARGVSAANHFRVVDAAKLLGINLMCIHTPCDNLAASYLDKQIKKAKPETVGEIITALKQIPEYQEAVKRKAGPQIFVGSPDSSAGKIALTEITGGTEGAVKLYEKMAQVGIGTVIGMHVDEAHVKEARRYHINIVIAGHISSDSIGINLFLDQLAKRGLDILPCSGLIRIKRNQSKK